MLRPPVVRVCLLGAESTGKTTLAAALAEGFGTLWAPEYGRVYTELGRDRDAPWTAGEFEHIARVHCWYEDFIAGLASRVLFVDTDAFTTSVFELAYLGETSGTYEDLVARRYDLYVVCGLDVPWRRDGWREFEEERRRHHEVYVAHAQGSGAPWLLAEGPHEHRVAAVSAAVGEMLAS